MVKSGLFITGTDTGVGKTFVTSLLASRLRDVVKVGVMKPAESDCQREGDRWMPKDAVMLKAAAGSDLPIELICPYALPKALAPAEAARQAGIEIDRERIKKTYQEIEKASDLVLVEGAGGLLVPLSGNYLYADLVKELDLPLLIVARAGLGTVNHSLLTIEAALSRGIRVVAVLLNENIPLNDDESFETNARVLRDIASVPVLGPLPHDLSRGSESKQTILKELLKEAFPELAPLFDSPNHRLTDS
jgi:dethiobiotin synthetase